MTTCDLRSITDVTKDGEWGKAEAFDSSVEMAVIRGTDFANARVGVLEDVPVRHIPEHIAARKRLQAFDILIETAGGTKDQPTGRTLFIKPSLVAKSALPLTCASFARFIRIDRSKANPEYVFWLLQSLYQVGAIRQYHTQHTGVARFQFTTFAEREPLALPDHTTQQRIASILSAYDDLIENNTRRIKILEEMAQMLYREWFVHFRFPGHEKVRLVESELGPIPETWSVTKVADLIKRHPAGQVYKESDVSQVGTVPVVDQSRDEFLGFHNETADHSASTEHPIAIFGDHTCKMRLMITPFSVGPNVVPFTSQKKKPMAYVFFLVRGLVSTHEYKRHWTELTNKAVVASTDAIATKFAEAVTPKLSMIEVLMRLNVNLRRTRDLLLPKLISGEIPIEATTELVEQTA